MVPKGWSHTTFEKHIDCLTGYAFSSTEYSAEEHDIRLLRGDNIEPGKLRWINAKRWPRNVQENMDKYFLLEGDFVIALDRTWISGGLKVAEVTCDDLPCLLVQRVARIRAKKTLAQGLLRQYFSGYKFEQYVKLTQTATAVPHISPNDIKQFSLLLPPIAEQKKIAQILSTWDKAISVTEKLLTNSQQQKKALMQQLLTGKKRLGMPADSYEFKLTHYGSIPKDWDYPAIKEVCTQVSEKNSEAADYPVLSCSKHDGFVDSLKYFNKKVYSDDLSGYRLIHRGCFGFPSNHIEEGSIGLQSLYETGIVSPIYVVFRASPTLVDNSYLYAVLKTDHYRQIFGAATNASVDRRGSLRWKEFSQIHVPLPPLKEQQKIAAVLSAADAEIFTLEKKLACLKDEKKALMQQLLTGKRRVKVEAEEAVSA
ncbi:restriction endonuclease subunit S [Cronobacter sakazakii]|nr:restriction endonuclease subunit S [Cronobacter sakazakii]ELY4357083.1 restriction endonuclease subunit S [Cronobacter sakazakii]